MFTQVKTRAFFVQDVLKNSEGGAGSGAQGLIDSCSASCTGPKGWFSGTLWQSDSALYDDDQVGCFMSCRRVRQDDESSGEASLTGSEGGRGSSSSGWEPTSVGDDNAHGDGHIAANSDPPLHVRILCCGGLSDTRARQLQWVWNVHIRPACLRVLCLFTLILSIATVFSEGFMFTQQDPDLSLFHLLLTAPSQKVQDVEAKVFICVAYMLLALFWAISQFRVGNFFRMVWNANTDSDSLLTSTFLLGRFVPPLIYNYLNLIYEAHPNSPVRPTISSFMGDVYVVPLIGKNINIYLPVLIIVGAVLTVFGCYSRLAILAGLQEAPDDETPAELQQRGMALIDRERKLALIKSDRDRRTDALRSDLRAAREGGTGGYTISSDVGSRGRSYAPSGGRDHREVRVDLDGLEDAMSADGQRRARRKSRERGMPGSGRPGSPSGGSSSSAGKGGIAGFWGKMSGRHQGAPAGYVQAASESPGNFGHSSEFSEGNGDVEMGDVSSGDGGASEKRGRKGDLLRDGPLHRKTGSSLRQWQSRHVVLDRSSGLRTFRTPSDYQRGIPNSAAACSLSPEDLFNATITISGADRSTFSVQPTGGETLSFQASCAADARQWAESLRTASQLSSSSQGIGRQSFGDLAVSDTWYCGIR